MLNIGFYLFKYNVRSGMYRFSALGHVRFQCARACTVSVRSGMYRFSALGHVPCLDTWVPLGRVYSCSKGSPKLGVSPVAQVPFTQKHSLQTETYTTDVAHARIEHARTPLWRNLYPFQTGYTTDKMPCDPMQPVMDWDPWC